MLLVHTVLYCCILLGIQVLLLYTSTSCCNRNSFSYETLKKCDFAIYIAFFLSSIHTFQCVHEFRFWQGQHISNLRIIGPIRMRIWNETKIEYNFWVILRKHCRVIGLPTRARPLSCTKGRQLSAKPGNCTDDVSVDLYSFYDVITGTGIILCMGPANDRRCYTVTPTLVGWAHTQTQTQKVTSVGQSHQ